MAGKTPREAVDNYISYLEETLSIITEDRLVVFPPSQKQFRAAYFPTPATVRLNNRTNLYISVVQLLATQPLPDGNHKVRTRFYSYILLEEPEVARHGVVSYHWHPHDSAVRFPHLHIKITGQLGYPDLEQKINRAHYPTSRVCLEDFVLLLIRYYDVKPRIPKDKWTRLLEKNKKAFDKWATWKIQHPSGI